MKEQEESPVPAITDEEIRRYVVSTHRSIQEIKTALVGNTLGTEGVLPRLGKVEGKVDAHDRKLLVWGSILSAGGTALVFIKDFVNRQTP